MDPSERDRDRVGFVFDRDSLMVKSSDGVKEKLNETDLDIVMSAVNFDLESDCVPMDFDRVGHEAVSEIVGADWLWEWDSERDAD